MNKEFFSDNGRKPAGDFVDSLFMRRRMKARTVQPIILPHFSSFPYSPQNVPDRLFSFTGYHGVITETTGRDNPDITASRRNMREVHENLPLFPETRVVTPSYEFHSREKSIKRNPAPGTGPNTNTGVRLEPDFPRDIPPAAPSLTIRSQEESQLLPEPEKEKTDKRPGKASWKKSAHDILPGNDDAMGPPQQKLNEKITPQIREKAIRGDEGPDSLRYPGAPSPVIKTPGRQGPGSPAYETRLLVHQNKETDQQSLLEHENERPRKKPDSDQALKISPSVVIFPKSQVQIPIPPKPQKIPDRARFQPTVYVSIGKIEIRAETRPRKQEQEPVPAKVMTLHEYLVKRRGGGT